MRTKDSFPSREESSTVPVERPGASGQNRDLCSNCDSGHLCGGRSRPRRPIFFCEGFEVSGPMPAPESDQPIEEKLAQARIGGPSIGLCVNCENAGTCTLPRPEGGIWHCEEYR